MENELRYARQGEKVSVSQFKDSTPKRPVYYYTAEDKRAIVQAYLDGVKFDEIFNTYGVLPIQIVAFLREAGYKPNRNVRVKDIAEADKNRIKNLYKEGYSIREVASLTGTKYSIVRQTLINENIPLRTVGKRSRKGNK